VTPIGVAIGFLTSFAGSFLAFVVWIHWHLEDHWTERKSRIEARRWARSKHGKVEMERYRKEAVHEHAQEEEGHQPATVAGRGSGAYPWIGRPHGR
jgi:hypothetical protein